MRDTTLCFLQRKNKLLLGMKKRGFAEGKWNGFGGKLLEGETILQAVIRELEEECGVKTEEQHAEKRAELSFRFPHKPEWDQKVHVFIFKKWENKPQETEEMLPQWFDLSKLPFDKMWSDDPYWLPRILHGEILCSDFTFAEDGETIKEFKLKRKEFLK